MDLTAAVWLLFPLFVSVRVNAHLMTVSTPHTSFICPVGANVTLTCIQSGVKDHPSDHVQHIWLFNPHMNQPCYRHNHPRSHGIGNKSNNTLGVFYKEEDATFHVTLRELTHDDQGKYCCLALDQSKSQHKQDPRQHDVYGHIMLTVSKRGNDTKCIVLDHTPPSQGSVAAGLAAALCIMFIFLLPLILVLVYRQKLGVHGSRRAHELVRMDSEAHGHENPVFLGGSPQPRIRILPQILTRQTSESGRHLLSDPGTPLTPNPHGEMFFPSQEPIPESPDFMQV